MSSRGQACVQFLRRAFLSPYCTKHETVQKVDKVVASVAFNRFVEEYGYSAEMSDFTDYIGTTCAKSSLCIACVCGSLVPSEVNNNEHSSERAVVPRLCAQGVVELFINNYHFDMDPNGVRTIKSIIDNCLKILQRDCSADFNDKKVVVFGVTEYSETSDMSMTIATGQRDSCVLILPLLDLTDSHPRGFVLVGLVQLKKIYVFALDLTLDYETCKKRAIPLINIMVLSGFVSANERIKIIPVCNLYFDPVCFFNEFDSDGKSTLNATAVLIITQIINIVIKDQPLGHCPQILMDVNGEKSVRHQIGNILRCNDARNAVYFQAQPLKVKLTQIPAYKDLKERGFKTLFGGNCSVPRHRRWYRCNRLNLMKNLRHKLEVFAFNYNVSLNWSHFIWQLRQHVGVRIWCPFCINRENRILAKVRKNMEEEKSKVTTKCIKSRGQLLVELAALAESKLSDGK